MSAYYLIANIVVRGFTLINAFALSYILGAQSYGHYIVLFSSAMFLNTICLSWIQASAAFFMVDSKSPQGNSHWRGTFLGGFLASAGGVLVVALCMSRWFGAELTKADFLVVVGLAVAMGLCDVAGAYLNGNSDAPGFFRLNLMRSFLSLLLGLGAAIAGFGASGAVAGMLLGLIVVTMTEQARKPWAGASLRQFSLAQARRAIGFGLPAAVVFGFFALIQAIYRNEIAANWGTAQAATFAFSLEVFTAPITLVAASVTYSFLPSLYRIGHEDDAAWHRSADDYLTSVLGFCVCFLVGSLYLGADLSRYYFPPEFKQEGAALVSVSSFFGVAFVVSSSLAFLWLAQGWRSLAMAVVGFLVLASYLSFSARLTTDYRQAAVLLAQAVSAVAVLSLALAAGMKTARPILGILLQFAWAALAMAAVLWLTRLFPQWTEPLSRGAFAAMAFALVAFRLKINAVTSLVGI